MSGSTGFRVPASADAALRVMLDRLRRAQAVAHVGSWELDLNTRTMWGSEEAFRIYGLPPTPGQALPYEETRKIPLPECRPALDEAMSALLAEGRPYDLDFQIARADDGQIRTVHSRAELVRDEAGCPVALVGTLQDITERKAMESALRSSEERFRMILEYAADAIFLGPLTGEIADVNQRACELSGYAREELLGRHLTLLFSADEIARRPFRFDRVLRGESVVAERVLTRKDGRRVPIEMHTKRLPDGTGQAILRDITARLQLEEQLQLRQRMDSVGTLASGIAHDFNNILVAILGAAELLEQDAPELTPENRETLALITQAGRRAADLVRRLQALSRPQSSSLGTFDLHAVASEVFHVLRETTDRRIAKEVRIPAGACSVHGSESDIYHALMNLGVNAVQAIETKGVSDGDLVSIAASDHDAPPGNDLGLEAGPYVHVRFADTGSGMDATTRQRAFDPLYSTKAKGSQKGHGLGLTMVYNIVVRQHRGLVAIESAVGAGTTFHLYLPRGAARLDRPAGVGGPAASAGRPA